MVCTSPKIKNHGLSDIVRAYFMSRGCHANDIHNLIQPHEPADERSVFYFLGEAFQDSETYHFEAAFWVLNFSPNKKAQEKTPKLLI